ncbi:MAG: N-acetylmuramic acid 6-phosphate etherase [Elusimicrobia bacterium]|nr:MAG: N-acetylmuramic acid 6-phosphate etherase [Elusimicrobiota bacterium]
MAVRYGKLATELGNPAAKRVDTKTSKEIVRLINREDAKVPAAVGRESASIAAAVDVIVKALSEGGKLFFVGAGTSGRLAVLEAAECPPTFGTPPSLVQAVVAGGKSAVFRSREGAEDDAKDGARQLRKRGSRGDVIVGIAASGITPFVRGALEAGKRAKCATVLVTSNPGSGMKAADIVIAPRVGPEFIAGSTRLKSGTAAKLVLNTLTAASFIRLGKVYDQWMLDLKPSNVKLKNRASRIIANLGRVSPKRADVLLVDSGLHVKTAVVMARLGVSKKSAGRLLRENGNSLRKVLESSS